ncbi:hypothetical protein AMES_2602 [Amycolatopsis mediterranei S699]|uniref:FtsX extracellular domain-containing protein n=2 Tax=Amycolatopsis mediterranei TaxID=33910 RepID=A0A0H3D0J6_AMYMU|nr:hypothetical protein AMED_2629 [Amycolatopsis mediterranei U32]AEK41162.1 hypothetical protein RAM_13360 [Amycolatopsis mediterranei S699]AGT83267.1 hypothetical protein B737_2603 [Amycolatopsis mediterranei RB]KDO06658.1 hypothetical protein DV26_31170 [Amycolatopsis mediterranei]AFO76138.1 hypothetical protein AMES_2602 [Amycolatopsis mediterranei S699]
MIFGVEQKPLTRVLVPVSALALAAGAGLAFFIAALVRPPELPVDPNPAPLAGHTLCAAVVVTYSSEEDMRAAVPSLRGDPKVRRVFVDPPSVSLLAVPGTDLKAWAQELHARYRKAERVTVIDSDATAAQLKLTAPPPKCPREGEY